MSSTVLGLFFKSPIETGGTNALTGARTGTLIEPAPWATAHGTYNVGDLVSSAGTAYSCNTQHTAGASLAADASKWDSLGACSQAPIAAVGTVYTLYFRTIDSVTGDDPVQDSTANITFTPPASTQVCQTYNGTFTSSALQLTVPATGANQPIYVKQVSSSGTTPGGLTISALSWTAGSRVAQVGTVTPTAASASIALSWSDITGETGYEIDRATDSGFSANLVHLCQQSAGTQLAANSTSYTNDATHPAGGTATPVDGTTYYYRVRGISNNGVGPWSAGVSAAYTGWTLDFSAGATLDATKVGVVTSGSGSATVASNKMSVVTAANADAVSVYFKNAMDRTKQERFTIKARKISIGASAAPEMMCVLEGAAAPPVGLNGTAVNPYMAVVTNMNASNSYGCINIMNAAKTPFSSFWSATANSWNSSVTDPNMIPTATATDYQFIFEHDATGFVVQIKNADGSTITNGRTSKILWSNMPAQANPWWVCMGEFYTDAWYCTSEVRLMKYEVGIGTVS